MEQVVTMKMEKVVRLQGKFIVLGIYIVRKAISMSAVYS